MLKRKLKIKLPFINYRLEAPEMLQAVLMIAVGFSTVPVLQETLGMSYEVALTAVAIAEIMGLLHTLFGDPVVPGWIASALSLVLVYLGNYAVGIESVHALIALQLILGVLFIVLGATGLAHKLIKVIPSSLKSGILLGAAFAALARVFKTGGYLEQYPLAVGVGTAVTLFMLFSMSFKKFKGKNKFLAAVGKYGMLPGLVAAMIVGFISGEIALPSVKWGFIPFSFKELFEGYSVFSIGFPSLQTFITALPMAFAVYIIAFGEIVTADSVLADAQAARPDEPLDFNSNRTNVIAGVRNVILSLFSPFTALAGPLWAAVSVSICERYKDGKKSMPSIFGGMGSFKLATAICVLLMPMATLLTPVLPIALAITLVVQGYTCAYIAFEQVKGDRVAMGVAGVSGAVVYIQSLNWGLAVGVVLFFLLQWQPKTKTNENYIVFNNERMKIMKANKENIIVTIDSEIGAHATEIATELAAHLNVPFYGSEIITEAANQSGISENLLRRYEERDVREAYNLNPDDQNGLRLPPAADFAHAQMLADRVIADKGSCVLLDHHATRALADRDRCVSIFIGADFDERVKNYAEEKGIDAATAKKELKRADKARRHYYRGYSKKWGDASAYSISVNTSGIAADEVANHIISFLETAMKEQLVNPTTGAARGA